jgi:hypothetical protein
MVLFAMLAMLFVSNSTQAQTSNLNEWTLHSVQSGVKVYYKIAKCSTTNLQDPQQILNDNNNSTLLLKFENLDADSKNISWSTVLKATNSNTFSSTLLAFNTKEIDCENSPSLSLKMNSSSIDPVSIIEALTYLNLTVVSN